MLLRLLKNQALRQTLRLTGDLKRGFLHSRDTNANIYLDFARSTVIIIDKNKNIIFINRQIS